MISYILLAFIALFAWGLWAFFPKLATNYIEPKSSLIFQSVAVLIVAVVTLFIMGFKVETHPKGILFALLAGLFGIIGSASFMYAIKLGSPVVVITITALYPVIAIILSYFFLGSTLTMINLIGIGLAVFGIILISL